MPNWCHCTLTITGKKTDLSRFAEQAKVEYEDEGEKEVQPLSFNQIVPMPGDDELGIFEERHPCTCCGGTGKRPWTQEEADRIGAATGVMAAPWPGDCNQEWAERCNGCNGCDGKGLSTTHPGWYNWSVQNWGTKWDANFSGPFVALVAEGSDIDTSVETNGFIQTPDVLVYKFDTAWSPPVRFIEQASEKWPNLNFVLRYGEPGGDFAGEARAEGGQILYEEELEVDEVLAPEQMWY